MHWSIFFVGGFQQPRVLVLAVVQSRIVTGFQSLRELCEADRLWYRIQQPKDVVLNNIASLYAPCLRSLVLDRSNANETKRPGEFVSLRFTFTAIGSLPSVDLFSTFFCFRATIRRQCSPFSQTRSFSGFPHFKWTFTIRRLSRYKLPRRDQDIPIKRRLSATTASLDVFEILSTK